MPGREIRITWTLEDFGVPVDEIIDIHLYVRKWSGMPATGTLGRVGEYVFLGQTGSGSASSFVWRQNAPGLARPFAGGPPAGLVPEFQIWLRVQKGERVRAMGPLLYFQVDGTPVPCREVRVNWHPEDWGLSAEAIIDVHLYVREWEGMPPAGNLRRMGPYVYLGRTGGGLTDRFVWRQNAPGLARPFAGGPPAGLVPEILLFVLVRQEDKGLVLGPVVPAIECSMIPGFGNDMPPLPIPSATPTVTPTPSG
jgi:hypothetical protein